MNRFMYKVKDNFFKGRGSADKASAGYGSPCENCGERLSQHTEGYWRGRFLPYIRCPEQVEEIIQEGKHS